MRKRSKCFTQGCLNISEKSFVTGWKFNEKFKAVLETWNIFVKGLGWAWRRFIPSTYTRLINYLNWWNLSSGICSILAGTNARLAKIYCTTDCRSPYFYQFPQYMEHDHSRITACATKWWIWVLQAYLGPYQTFMTPHIKTTIFEWIHCINISKTNSDEKKVNSNYNTVVNFSNDFLFSGNLRHDTHFFAVKT